MAERCPVQHQRFRPQAREQTPRWAAAWLLALVIAAVPPSGHCAALVQARFDVDGASTCVPTSYFGFSLEYGSAAATLTTAPTFIQLVRGLTKGSNGPLVVRVGGNSQDMLTAVPPLSTWRALRGLHGQLGVRFIIGVNFASLNLTLAVAHARMALKQLPRSSIIAFEVGNEPDHYTKGKLRGPNYTPNGYLRQYIPFRQKFRTALLGFPVVGPSWKDVSLPGDLMARLVGKAPHQQLVRVSVHCYSGNGRSPDTDIHTILAEAATAARARVVVPRVALGKKLHAPVIIGEMNSLYGGGKAGVSDTFSAALWSADMSFEMARAGAAGVNYHTPLGSAYSAFGKAGSTVFGAAPFYGHWLFQTAVSNRGCIIKAPQLLRSVEHVKVWAVVAGAGQSRQLRVVVLNKNTAITGNLPIQFQIAKAYGRHKGSLSYLLGGSYYAKSGITFGGKSADPRKKNYAFKAGSTLGGQTISSVAVGPKFVQYQFSLPHASAALLVIALS